MIMMKDLIKKIDSIIMEAEVKPGEKKEISFKIAKLEKLREKINIYKNSLSSIARANLPPELLDDRDNLHKKLEQIISKIEHEHNELFRKYHNSDVPIKLSNLLRGIRKNCSQIIKIYQQINDYDDYNKKRFLYRGIRSYEDALYGKPFDARRPKDSVLEINQLADKALTNAGFKARRTNSIFTTSNKEQASNYGNVYIIFPVDGFDFTYSRRNSDLVLNEGFMEYFVDEDVKKSLKELLKSELKKDGPAKNVMLSVFKDEKYIDNTFLNNSNMLSNHIESIRKLIEKGILPEKTQTLLKNLLTNYDNFINQMQFDNTNIYNAILSNNEIYISGAYYAIKASYVSEIIKFLKNEDTSNIKILEKYGDPPSHIYTAGEIVKITSGKYKGEIGVIENDGLEKLSISLKYDEPSVVLSSEQIELLPDQSQYKFNINDRVIIVNKDDLYYGYSGKVVHKYEDYKIVVQIDDINFKKPYNSIELVKETPEKLKKYENIKKQFPQKGDIYIITKTQSPFKGRAVIIEDFSSSGHLKVSLPGAGDLILYLDLDDVTKLDEYKGKIKPVIYKNHKVKVIKGHYKGKIGTVKTFYSDGHIEINFIGDFNNTYIPYDSLEPYYDSKTENEANNGSIKVGDIVQVNDDTLPFNGEFVKVIKIEYDSDQPIAAIETAKNKKESIKLSSLKKIQITDEMENPLKIGDTVSISSASHTQKYIVKDFFVDTFNGIIARIKDSHRTYDIPINDLIKDTSEKPKFNVGDYVEIISAESSLKGEIGVIEEINSSSDGFVYVVKMEEPPYEQLKFTEEELKTYDDSTSDNSLPNTLKNGDKVRVIDKNSEFYGKEGTVVYIWNSTTQVNVEDSITHEEFIVDKTSLRKIKNFSTVNQTDNLEISDFTVGDLVKIKKTGKIGKVISIVPNNLYPIKIKSQNGKFFVYKTSELDIISKATNNTLSNNDKIEIKVGDKVKIIAPNSVYYTKTGEVINIHSALYTVKINDNNNILAFHKNEIQKVEDATDNSDNSDISKNASNKKLSIDDVVTIHGSNLVPDGTYGMIVDSIDFVVKILEGGSYGKLFKIPSKNLRLVPPYKKGDVVMVINPVLNVFGTVGKISKVYPNESMYMIDSMDGNNHSFACKKQSIKKISANFVKPTKQDTSDFKVGDKVKINLPSSPHHDEIGIVKYVGDYAVDIDINGEITTFLKKQLKKI
jgi:transcription antitermination factor NusG